MLATIITTTIIITLIPTKFRGGGGRAQKLNDLSKSQSKQVTESG